MEIEKAVVRFGKIYKTGKKALWADVPLKNFRAAMEIMESFSCRLITISGTDAGKGIEVIYHFDLNGHVTNLKFTLPVKKPAIPSARELFPGAEFYERELCEMIGVDVEGVEKRALFLAKDSPKTPLRRGKT